MEISVLHYPFTQIDFITVVTVSQQLFFNPPNTSSISTIFQFRAFIYIIYFVPRILLNVVF